MMTDRERIIDTFLCLTAFDAESFHEQEIGQELQARLTELGLRTQMDAAGNLYGVLEATRDGEPLLFSAHMDTVSPGKGKKAIVGEDGIIRSDGTTVLGADDLSGVVSILEALRVIRDNGLDHPVIEVLITVAEEPFCRGSAAFDYGRIRSKEAYVLDLSGPIGTAALAAPSILALDITVKGKAAHAGFAPEKGINALNAAVKALARIRTGRVDADTTVNFGLIEGGSVRNAVPETVSVKGEIRSMKQERVREKVEMIRRTFLEEAEKIGASVQIEHPVDLPACSTERNAPVVKRFEKALALLGYGEGTFITTFGGSDNNRFFVRGISGIVTACAMENVHTTSEYTVIDELQRSCELALTLMTME